MSSPTRTTTPLHTVAIFNTSDDTVEMLKIMLEIRHFRTVAGRANDVKRGRCDIVAFMAEHNPAVVIWDIAPPYDDNWSFFKHLRSSGHFGGRDAVLTTTEKGHLDQSAGQDTGAIEILGKADDLERVVDTVARLAASFDISPFGRAKVRPHKAV